MRQQVAQPGSKENVARTQMRQPQPAVQRPQPRGVTAELLNLQRTHGNRFVQQLLNGGMLQRKCACGGGCPRCQKASLLQTKLKINEPGDRYEQEADRIADEVMRMPEPAIQRQVEPEEEEGVVQTKSISSQITPLVQRQAISEMEEEEEGMVQTKAIANQAAPSTSTQKSSEPPPIPPIVHEVLNSPGQPLDTETRDFMESRFGHGFSQVRIHMDEKAAESARAVDALAYTVKQDVVFGSQQYAPITTTGKRLLAHELIHVMQQESASSPASGLAAESPDLYAREANSLAGSIVHGGDFVSKPTHLSTQRVQRQRIIPGGGATPGVGKGIDLIFIIKSSAGDEFTAAMERYIRTVLQGQVYEKVDNLDDIFRYLATVGQRGQKVRRIRIVAHGSPAMKGKHRGGVKMTPPGEQKRRWFSPEEITKYASREDVRSIARSVMTPGTVVEFWGCNIGKVPEAGKAWAGLFHSTFKASKATFKTLTYRFARPSQKGERGESVPNLKGRWIQIKHTSEIDKSIQEEFNNFLLGVYLDLIRNGDISPVSEGSPDNPIKPIIKFMRELFNHAEGDIRRIVLEKSRSQRIIGPGNREEWSSLWVEFDPVSLENLAQGKSVEKVPEKTAPTTERLTQEKSHSAESMPQTASPKRTVAEKATQSPTSPKESQISEELVARFGAFAPKTIAQLLTLSRVLVSELHHDLEDLESGATVRAEAEEWIHGVESWQTFLESRGTTPIDQFSAKQALKWNKDLLRLRAEIYASKARLVSERLKASQAALLNLLNKVEEDRPKLNEAMRVAFHEGDSSRLAELSGQVNTALDIGLSLHGLVSMMKKALDELRKEVSPRYIVPRDPRGMLQYRLVEIPPPAVFTEWITKVNQALAAINTFYALTHLQAPTDLGKAMKGINAMSGTYGASLTLFKLPEHMSLYADFYLVPLTQIVVSRVDKLVDRHLHELNIVALQTGFAVNVRGYPGGLVMHNFMTRVMQADSPQNIPPIPDDVKKELLDQRELIQSGIRRPGSDIPTTGWFWRGLDAVRIRDWLYQHRQELWAMFYGNLSYSGVQSD